MTNTWLGFKSCTYLVGVTYILIDLALRNMMIILELLYYRSTIYALITLELTLMLFPIWVLAIGQIIREWKKELSYEQGVEL